MIYVPGIVYLLGNYRAIDQADAFAGGTKVVEMQDVSQFSQVDGRRNSRRVGIELDWRLCGEIEGGPAGEPVEIQSQLGLARGVARWRGNDLPQLLASSALIQAKF